MWKSVRLVSQRGPWAHWFKQKIRLSVRPSYPVNRITWTQQEFPAGTTCWWRNAGKDSQNCFVRKLDSHCILSVVAVPANQMSRSLWSHTCNHPVPFQHCCLLPGLFVPCRGEEVEVEQKMWTENRRGVDLPPENEHLADTWFVVKVYWDAERLKEFRG